MSSYTIASVLLLSLLFWGFGIFFVFNGVGGLF